MRKLHTTFDPRYALAGFKQFVEDGVNSLEPDAKGTDSDSDKEDYLGALDDELGYDWKMGVMKDRVIVLEPIEIGPYVYKTSAWKVLDTDEKFVTIQLDPHGAPNLAKNVFRKRHDGNLERVGPNHPFDTTPHTIPREMFAKMLDAALRAAQQGGGGAGAGAPPGGPPGGPGLPPGGAGAPPGGPPGGGPM